MILDQLCPTVIGGIAHNNILWEFGAIGGHALFAQLGKKGVSPNCPELPQDIVVSDTTDNSWT